MELKYQVTGSGPLVVLVHGITESRETWKPLVAPIAGIGRTVLSLDLRGHGESAPGDVYDPITMAADVHETLVAAGLSGTDPSPLMIGHSMGGVVVSAYAAMFPVRGVVNIDQPLRLAGFKEGLSQLEPILKGDTESFTGAIDMLFQSMMGELTGAEAARVSALRRPRQAVVLGIWGTVFESSPQELDAQVEALTGNVTAPYHSLHGIDPGDDYTNWLVQAVPTASVEVWPGLGHYPHLVQQERFVDLVVGLDRQAH